jgi:hypothetical protein
MTIEQTIEVPASRRITLELPHSVPCGIEANVKIKIPAFDKIDEVRQLLRKEMDRNGTGAVPAASGNGWESHVREQYAKP